MGIAEMETRLTRVSTQIEQIEQFVLAAGEPQLCLLAGILREHLVDELDFLHECIAEEQVKGDSNG